MEGAAELDSEEAELDLEEAMLDLDLKPLEELKSMVPELEEITRELGTAMDRLSNPEDSIEEETRTPKDDEVENSLEETFPETEAFIDSEIAIEEFW